MASILQRLKGRRAAVEQGSDGPGEIELQAAGVRVVIVPAQGGRITTLELGGRQWLAQGAPAEGTPEDARGGATGWEECFPTVGAARMVSKHSGLAIDLPALGEVRTLRPATSISTLDGALEATCVWTGERMPYRLTRTTRVAPLEVTTRYSVTSLGNAPMPFIWAANIALPLGGATRLTLPENARARVLAQHGMDMLGVGAEHRWPRFRTAKKIVDMTAPGAVGGRWTAHVSFDMPVGQVGVAEGSARLEGRFEPTVISRVGLAVRQRASAANLVTLQPSIGIPDALAHGAGVDASAAWLEPGETRQWAMTWRAGGEQG
ncbi:MAG TPA: hypothetical protein VHM30_12695 [Gemmatimonadaceae bacterium]|nr:hypothetical protein [Gemmatimonadaceae bacterium]